MRVLVTGGNGYIGRNVVKKLVLAGHDPIIVDNCDNSNEFSGRKFVMDMRQLQRKFDKDTVSFIKLNYEDLNLEAICPDAVIHLAAYKSVLESAKYPDSYWQNNVVNSLKLIRNSRAAGVQLFLYSSSASVYGPSSKSVDKDHLVGNSEWDACNPVSVYGVTKRVVEEYLASFSKTDKMLCRSLRYFNVVGSGGEDLGDRGRDRFSTLFGRCASALLNPSKPLVIRGNKYETPDGFAVRDFIDVEDLADAHVSVVSKSIERLGTPCNPVYEVLNVGTGKPVSVMQVVEEFGRQGKEVPHEIGSWVDGEVACSFANVGLIDQMYGWRAKKTLEDMVRGTLQFYQL